MAEKESQEQEKREFLEKARKRYKYALDAWSRNYEDMDEDIEFIHGENQWEPKIKADRRIEGRPCLSFNKLPAVIDQAVGDQRRASPTIKITPQQNNIQPQNTRIQNHAGTKDYSLAETFEGIIRNIQLQSEAQIAYDTAYEHAASWGLGWFRIRTDYLDENSFDQEFIIEAVPNYKSVVADPDFVKPDGSDIKWAFIVSQIPNDEYEDKYGETPTGEWDLIQTDQLPQWRTSEFTTIAEYYYFEDEVFTLYQTADGQVYKDQLPAGQKSVNSRVVKGKKVSVSKISGTKILEQSDTVFAYIPVIPVVGKSLVVDGITYYRGLVRHAKDAQRMYNYSRSADIERTALTPKVPYIIADQQIEGHENEWATATQKNPSVLKYKAIPGIPPPERQAPVQSNPGETAQSMQADADIKATTGLQNESQGIQSNAMSGKAIIARQTQGDTILVVFADNLSRSMSHTGKILVEAIPRLYDTARILRIRFPDGNDDFVPINQQGPNGELTNDLSVAKFDVAVETGPAYSTQRAEALDAMVQLIQANPSLWNVIGDLIAKNMDWPGAQEFEKRLRLQLPDNLLTPEEIQQKGPPPPPSSEDQADIATANAQIAKAHAAMAEVEANIKMSEAKMMQAEAMSLQAIEKINNLPGMIQDQVAEAIADALIQQAQQTFPSPASPTNPPQPGAS